MKLVNVTGSAIAKLIVPISDFLKLEMYTVTSRSEICCPYANSFHYFHLNLIDLDLTHDENFE